MQMHYSLYIYKNSLYVNLELDSLHQVLNMVSGINRALYKCPPAISIIFINFLLE